jgi:hypothetical protein
MIEFWHQGSLTLQEADQAIAGLEAHDLIRLAAKAVDGVKWDQLTDEQRKAQRAWNTLAGRQLATQRQAAQEAQRARSAALHQRLADEDARTAPILESVRTRVMQEWNGGL